MATKNTSQNNKRNTKTTSKKANKPSISSNKTATNKRVRPSNPVTNQMQNEAVGIVLVTIGVVFLGMLIPTLAPQASAEQLRFSLSQSIGLGRWFLPWPLIVIGGLLFLKRLPERWQQRLFGYGVLAAGIWLFIAFCIPAFSWVGNGGVLLGGLLRRLSILGLLISIIVISLGVDMLVDIPPTLTARRGLQRLRSGFGRGFRGLWQWRAKQKRAANYSADKALVQKQLRVLDKDVKTLGLVHDSAEEQAHLQNWHNTIAQLRDRLHLSKAHHSEADEMLENGIATARDWRDAVDGFTQESSQLLAERISEEGIEDFDGGIAQLRHRIGNDIAQLHPVGKALEKKRQHVARELDNVSKHYHQLLDARDSNISQLRKADAQTLAKVYQQYEQRLDKYQQLTERCSGIAASTEKLESWRAYSAELYALESRHAGEPFDALVKDQAKLLNQGLDTLSAQQARAEVNALLEQLNIPVPATARPFAYTEEATYNHNAEQQRQPTQNNGIPTNEIATRDAATYPPYGETQPHHVRQVGQIDDINPQITGIPQQDNRNDAHRIDGMHGGSSRDFARDFEGVEQGELERAIIEEMVHDSTINTNTLPVPEGDVRFKPKLSVNSSIPKPSKPSFPTTDWQRPAEPVRFNDLNPDEAIDAVPNTYVESFQRPSHSATEQPASTPNSLDNPATGTTSTSAPTNAMMAASAVAEGVGSSIGVHNAAAQETTATHARENDMRNDAIGYDARFPTKQPAQQNTLDFESERINQKWQPEASHASVEDTINFATGPVVSTELDLPNITILQPKKLPSPELQLDDRHVLERTSIINRTIQSFKLNGQVKKSVRGPTVSRFEIKPAEGEKISRYANLSDDIALAMGVESVRVEAPIQGKKNIIGLEVPNEKRDLVSFREAIEDEAFAGASGKKLPIVLGRSIDGEMRIEDLGKMPHLLIAGSTGSGKSVAVNVLISSLLYRYTPEKLRFLMIDPKMVELTPYDAVPHLLRPVVTNPNDASGVLLGAVAHMERRYKMMSKIGAKSLEQYNAKAKELEMPEMPYIVIIIDELADLMITSPKEVESAIMRLAQMARATGMHLILATQRPSVDILTSLIKVNIPARIAFAVSSSHDSRTILDAMGAERLTGQGDMLFYKPGLVKSIRLQGPFVSESEVAAIAEHWGNQTPFFEDEFVEAYGGDFDPTPDNDSDVSLVDWNDDKLRDAAELVVAEGQASVSRLQRRLQVGHARAGKLMDSLEALAIVGPHQGSKPREVLVVMADLPNILGRG